MIVQQKWNKDTTSTSTSTSARLFVSILCQPKTPMFMSLKLQMYWRYFYDKTYYQTY